MGLSADTRLGRPRRRTWKGNAGALLNGRANAAWYLQDLPVDIQQNRAYPPYPQTADRILIWKNGVLQHFGTTAEPRNVTFVAADQNTKVGWRFTVGNEPADNDDVTVCY